MTDIHNLKDRQWEDRYQAWKAKRENKKIEEQQNEIKEKIAKIDSKSNIFNDFNETNINTSNFIKKEEREIVHEIKRAENFIEREEREHPLISKILIFLAFAIPIAILLYALYINFLPFGYSNNYQLIINSTSGEINPISSDLYLTNSNGRKLLSLPEGVNGQINAVLIPKVVLRNATVNVSIEGTGISLATPISFNADNYTWDYNWNFANGIPISLNGTAKYDNEDNSSACVRFNAVNDEIISLPNSQNLFESNPLTIYVKWLPSSLSGQLGNYQEIVGHYNWEIYQNANSVSFQIGRVNNGNGTFYAINYPIKSDFFDKKHEAIAIYNPGDSGYIQFWVDGNLAGITSIGNDTIYNDYNANRPLSFGWIDHNYGSNPYFDGCIYNARISNQAIRISNDKMSNSFTSSDKIITIPIIGNGNLTSVKLEVKE